MKLCYAYRLWLKKQYQLGGEGGTGAIQGLVLQTKASPKNEATEMRESKGPSCWICLEAGPDESGQPLRRDCACRGESAGFAHLYCIVKYAEHKQNDQAHTFVNQAWCKCPNCLQYYQNGLRLDLMTNLVAFTKKKHPGNQEICLEALFLKLMALDQAKQGTEAEETGSKIISIIGRLRSSNTSLPKRIYMVEAETYHSLGNVALQERTKDSAKAALAHFERFRAISNAVGDIGDVMLAEDKVAFAKSKCGEDTNISMGEELKRCQERYEWRVKKYGKEAQCTILSGLNLSLALQSAEQGLEAERWAAKVFNICERVLGPDHNLTQDSSSWLELIKVRRVRVSLGNEWQRYHALQYTDDGAKCIVQGPILDPRNVKEEKQHTVAVKGIVPELGTPIVCHGLDSSPHLNGKIGELISWDGVTDCYEVRFDDKDLESCMVKRDNVQILFELPDE